MAEEGELPVNPTRQLALAIGSRVAELRLKRGYTPQELAFRSGISRPYLFALEHHGPNFSIDLLRRLALALGVTIIDLLPQEDAQAAAMRGNARHLEAVREGVRETRSALAEVAEATAALQRAAAAFRVAASEIVATSPEQPASSGPKEPSED